MGEREEKEGREAGGKWKDCMEKEGGMNGWMDERINTSNGKGDVFQFLKRVR